MELIKGFFQGYKWTDIAQFGILLCGIILMIVITRIANASEDDFDKWLLENSTKTDQGHYLYSHDKSGRLYSRTELRNFFNQRKVD